VQNSNPKQCTTWQAAGLRRGLKQAWIMSLSPKAVKLARCFVPASQCLGIVTLPHRELSDLSAAGVVADPRTMDIHAPLIAKPKGVDASNETTTAIATMPNPSPINNPTPRRQPNSVLQGLLAWPRGHALQLRVVVWTTALVVCSTLGCAIWLTQISRETMASSHRLGVAALGKAAAWSLSGQIEGGWLADAGRVMDGLMLDPRLAFAIVTNTEGETVYRMAVDPKAWVAYVNLTSGKGDGTENSPLALDAGEPIRLDDRSDLLVFKAPVWHEVVSGNGVARRKPEGFLILAMRDSSMPQLLARLERAELLAAAGICFLAVPLVVSLVRGWLKPIRVLTEAAVAMREGAKPGRLAATGRDELATLTAAFNQMSRWLYAAKLRLQRANRQLERKVAIRTAELAEANEHLEAQIADKNEFLRAVSHDLGAPVRNINGMAAMMLVKYRDVLEQDALSKLDRICANAKHQSELIQDLLDLSKIRSAPSARQPVDLGQLLEEVRQTLCHDLEQAGVELEIKGPMPTIHAERNRMRQLFQNLIDNAIKYMGDGPVRKILVTSRPTQQCGVYAFEVADTGRGIEERDLPNIFGVFKRALYSGKLEAPGRGVGLASVKSIVEAYDGTISASSQLGEGTTFCFTLTDGPEKLAGAVGNEKDASLAKASAA